MSLLDLFTGHFTWSQLLREVAPILLASASAFFAGYWKGRNDEMRRLSGLVIRALNALQPFAMRGANPRSPITEFDCGDAAKDYAELDAAMKTE